MSATRVHDAFGTFFEVLRKLESEPSPAVERGPTAVLPDLAQSLVKKIPPPGDPRELLDLILESGMGFDDFTQALSALQRRNWAVVHGSPGHEKVELTPEGKRVAEAA